MPVTTHIIDVTAQANADLLSCIAKTVYFIVVKFFLVNLLLERTIIYTEICSMICNAGKSVFVHILVTEPVIPIYFMLKSRALQNTS